jgi:hypothetical protein
MIPWLIGITTLVLLVFVIWRKTSKSFSERSEEPKFLFLENLGVPRTQVQPLNQTNSPEEDRHAPNHS